jgi:thioesterase domain-containing protein
MGRGGVLAYPMTLGLEEQGFNETNMILYDRYGFEELGERLDSMSDKEVSDMSEAAIILVGERHLWTHRLLEIQRKVQA